MLRTLALVVSIGLADSLNPTTIAPALYLAGGKRPRAQVLKFALGVFGVYMIGGLAIALGLGQLILSLVPHPDREDGYVLEIIAGVAMLTAAAFVWGYRDRLAQRPVPQPRTEGRSSAILGATITVVELPTAFPYFAAIAAIVGSGLGPARQAVLLVIFNLCFILPLIGIVATLTLAGDHAATLLASGRRKLEAHWPAVVAALALIAGVFVTLLGITGLVGLRHGHLGKLFRRFHKILRP